MTTKTKRGKLKLPVTIQVDGPTLARVIAFEATRDEKGGYRAPDWTATRAHTLRHATRVILDWGLTHFTGHRGSWSGEIVIDEIASALAVGRRVVKRHFPEL